MSERIYNVLFLCTGNSARSIMAEGILRKDGGGRFRSFSAGSQPKGEVIPLAIETLVAHGYPWAGSRSKSWDEFAVTGAPKMDFVFTVCDGTAGETCPVWPGQPITAHWGIEDPAAVAGTVIEKLRAFDRAFLFLRNRISVLVVLITILGPVSGAHFNPAVSLVFVARGELDRSEACLYVLAQVLGGIAGTLIAHGMFALPAIELSLKARSGAAQWFSEFVATFGLVTAILAGIRFHKAAVPWLVGLYITAAYWFTASTSFANPAVALARALTDTFSGIRPIDLPGFILAQLAGAFAALALMTWLLAKHRPLSQAGEDV